MGRRYYNGNIRKALGGLWEVIHSKRNYRDLETAFKTVFIFEFAIPAIVGASIKVFELLEKDTTLRDQLEWNYFRDGMKSRF
jgi:glycine C-acetyltransferase